MKLLYSSLEKELNLKTPEWIVNIGELQQEFGKSNFKLVIPFKGKIVQKSYPMDKEVINHNCKTGMPDFAILTSEQLEILNTQIKLARKGMPYLDPFRWLGCNSNFFIEVNGSYWHSGDYVQNLSKENHEAQVIEAYKSAGSEVLVLWDDDISLYWNEVGKIKLDNFISKFKKVYPQKINNNIGTFLPKEENKNISKSLQNPMYWRSLDEISKNKVVNNLIDTYSEIDFPFPDCYSAYTDFKRFISWTKGTTRKPTQFGNKCCAHYIQSFIDSHVKNKPTLREIWQNQELMKECIEYQLTNETGIHHAKRFLNAMCYKQGFRIISNLLPSFVYIWVLKITKKSLNGGIFYDPCAGWGGRMLAAHAFGMKYRAIDANLQLVNELNNMAKELNIDAVIIYGDSSCKEDVYRLLGNNKVDIVFTSPPYFDKEIYSNDSKQSILMNKSESDWYFNFCANMINNSFEVLKDDGFALFNVDYDFNYSLFSDKLSKSINFKDIDVWKQSARKNIRERLIILTKESFDIGIENQDYVSCKLCGRVLQRVKKHLKTAHSMDVSEYLKLFPNATLICDVDRKRVSNENKSKNRSDGYIKRTVYRCPDGSIVRKSDKWKKAWNLENPPLDSVLDASFVNLNRWEGKKKDIDYVECSLCGFKGKNIKRHIKKKHSNIVYSGKLYSSNYLKECSSSANSVWDKIGRKLKKDSSLNKTHKEHGLTKEILNKLYIKNGLSDVIIGSKYGITDIAVSYYRKKWGIKTISVMERLKSQENENEILLSTASKKFNISEDRLRKQISNLIPSKIISDCKFYKVSDLTRLISSWNLPEGYLNYEMIGKIIDKNTRQTRDIIKRIDITPKGFYGTKFEWYSPDIIQNLK